MGEEAYYIDALSKYIETHVLSEEEEKSFNQTVLYAKETSIDEIISCCKRYPMMSKYQVIIVKEGQDLSRKIEQLSNYMLNPMLSTVLIFNFRNKTLDKRKKLFKSVF